MGTNGAKFWDFVTKISIPLVFIASAAVITHEVRISIIESNRFTDVDAARMHEEMAGETATREDIAELKTLVKENGKRLRQLEIRIRK